MLTTLRKHALVALVGALPLALYLLATHFFHHGAPPASPLQSPAEVRVPLGKIAFVKAEGKADPVVWYFEGDYPDLDSFTTDNGRTLCLVASKPGSYRLKAVGYYKGKLYTSVTSVVVGTAPPNPNPVPPNPSDPLYSALKAAYDKDPSPQKKAQVVQLAAFYKQASLSTVNQPDIATIGALYQVLRDALPSLVPDTALSELRNALAAELKSKLPSAATAPLDPATRQLCATQFVRISNLLSTLAAV